MLEWGPGAGVESTCWNEESHYREPDIRLLPGGVHMQASVYFLDPSSMHSPSFVHS